MRAVAALLVATSPVRSEMVPPIKCSPPSVVRAAPCDFTVPAAVPGALHSVADAVAAAFAAGDAADDVVVCLGPGTHTLAGRPLRLNASHTHPRGGRMVWRGDAAAPSTVSAGVPLTKWARCVGDPSSGCNSPEYAGVWVHKVADIPNVTSTAVPFRQLWVAGRRAPRVVVNGTELGLDGNIGTGFGYRLPKPAAGDWVGSEVEFRWPGQLPYDWTEPRCIVSGVSGADVNVSLECWRQISDYPTKLSDYQQLSNYQTISGDNTHTPSGVKRPRDAPLLVENAPAPPPPGEFQANREYVFYRPPGGEDEAPSDAWAPLLESIVEGDGVAGHTFTDLTFEHATWRQPSTPQGYIPNQAGVSMMGTPDRQNGLPPNSSYAEPLGAVRFTNATEIHVTRCVFRNSGAQYGVSATEASRCVAITRTSFTDLAGGAVKLGNVQFYYDPTGRGWHPRADKPELTPRHMTTDPARMDAGFEVSDNTITNVAIEFRDMPAVFAGYVRAANIAHNMIRKTRYSGISLGWGWGLYVTGPQTFMRDNRVVGNHIEDVMRAIVDGACIYTLGPQPNSTLAENYCTGVAQPWNQFTARIVSNSYYHDEGSRFFTTDRNVASDGVGTCIYLQGFGRPALDLTVSNLWCRNECTLAPCHNWGPPATVKGVANTCVRGNVIGNKGGQPVIVNCSAHYGEDMPSPKVTDDDCRCHVDLDSVHVLPTGAAWPAEAQSIVDAAGPRA